MHAYAYICVYTVYAYVCVHIYIIMYISTASYEWMALAEG